MPSSDLDPTCRLQVLLPWRQLSFCPLGLQRGWKTTLTCKMCDWHASFGEIDQNGCGKKKCLHCRSCRRIKGCLAQTLHTRPPSFVRELGQATAKHGPERKGRVLGTNRPGTWCLLKGSLPEANGNTSGSRFPFFRPLSLASCATANQPASLLPGALKVNRSAFDHSQLSGSE